MKQKLYLFLFLSCFLEIPFSISQNKPIFVDLEETSMKRIFEQIEKQTSYTIAYNETDLDLHKKIPLTSFSYDLDPLLTLLLKDTSFGYKKRSTTSLLSRYPKPCMIPIPILGTSREK